MAYYRFRIEVWCDWDPAASDLNVEHINSGDAICTSREVIDEVDRPQDIEDEAAMDAFYGSTQKPGRS